jgi:serine/threonine-protein kinase
VPNICPGPVPPCPYGKYELLERIGSGGMAEVFRARMPGVAGFEKIVVIKRLLPHLTDDEGMVAMFVEEAKLAAQVQHKNVVQVHELDQLPNGEFYIVMEYVQGTDLRKLLQRARRSMRRIPAWLSVHACVEVLDALVFAHGLVDPNGRRRNIVHRDVSPDNIFISDLGDIKLGDFGVAKDESRPKEPLADQIKGKISYMAPEQFSGMKIDQRYDVFALGVVLWECLAQRSLFRAETAAATMNLICRGRRVPPSHFTPDVPRELDACVLKALDPDRDKRIPSTREMQAILRDLLVRLRSNVGPIEVRNEIQFLCSEEITRPGTPRSGGVASPTGPSRSEPIDRGTVEITDEEIIGERILRPDRAENVRREETRKLEPRALSDDWDGTYAIINPRLRAEPPMPGKKSTVETDDLVARHLVYEIPMPGGPSLVETGDIVRASSDDDVILATDALGPDELPIDEPVAWDPNGSVLSSDTPISNSRIWQPYSGLYPFWLRSQGQVEFGPCSLVDLLQMIRSRIPSHAKGTIEVSGNRTHWVPLSRYMVMTAQDVLEQDMPIVDGVVSGLVEGLGVISLLGQIAEHRPTGRLRIMHHAQTKVDTTEIQLMYGLPTHVSTNDTSLETPEQLLRYRILDEKSLAECMHAVVTEERPLHQIVAQRSSIDLGQHWVRFMLARLEPLMTWDVATYTFLNVPPDYVVPFAPSLLSLLPTLIQRVKTIDQLKSVLSYAMEMGFERSERFDRLLPVLGLTSSQLVGLNPFGLTRTLGEALRCSLGGEKLALTMGCILIHLGMIAPRTVGVHPVR